MGRILSANGVWIRKISRNFEDHGLRTLLRKALAFLIRPFYEDRTYRLYAIHLTHANLPVPAEIDGIEFRFLSSTHTKEIEQVESMSEWLHGTVTTRLNEGALCLVAFEGERLAGFNLISFGNVFMPLVNLHRRFRKDEGWSEQIAVAKDYRKHGLGANLRYRIFRELKFRGYRKLYGGALVDNVPSLKLAQRVGFHEFVDIRFTKRIRSMKWRYSRVH
ncbi:MAG TPA: GNAT family N-acetyltransferase [Terriglobales bacterium]